MLQALTLDYCSTRRAPSRNELILLLSSVVIAIVLTLIHQSITTDIIALEEQQVQLQPSTSRRTTDKRLAGLDQQQIKAEIKQANEILAQLSLPWDDLFRDIEDSAQNRIALLSIEPNAEKRLVRLTGEARNLGAMLSYIQHLQQRKSLSNVYLVSHQVDQSTAEKPIRFTVNAGWTFQ